MNADEGELPEGWVNCDLPQAAEIVMGQSPPGSTYNDDGDGLPFFQGKADFGPLHPTVRKWCTAPTKLAESGDILISIRAPVGPTNIATVRCAIGRGLAAVRARGPIENRWLLYALRLQEADLAEQGTGSTFTAINREHLDAVKLPLPPLVEQRRIVTAAETVLAKVSAARERLNRVPAILKRFRQAVLSAACSGRLTADWRDAVADDEELPMGWERTHLGKLLVDKPQNGLYKPQSEYGTGTLILRIDNFYEGVVEPWANLKRVKLAQAEIDQYGLANDDVVVNRVNSFKLLGKCALVRGLTESCVFESNMMRLRLDAAKVCSEFAIVVLCSPEGRDQIRANAKHAVNQASINQGDVQAVELSLPPLAEQQEIVRRVGKLFALADVIEARLADARRMADRLTQAVLAKAFRGELVPTEAELARREGRTYEPAADLLARVRAERPPTAPKPARARKPKADPA